MRKLISITLCMLGLVLPLSSAVAEWSVNRQASSINFISIKKNSIAEMHHFKSFDGRLSKSGEFQFTVDLSSVETLIPIRNERMLKHLFETDTYATALVTAKLADKQVNALLAGKQQVAEIPCVLSLHGKSKELMAKVVVRKLDSNSVSVVTVEPLIVNAADFDLTAGIVTLQKLAGLNAIATAVPVSFHLQLEK